MNLKSIISSIFFFTITLIVSIINVASASEQTIATILKDDNIKITYKLVIESNDGRSIQNFYKDVYEKGVKIRRDSLNPSVIMKSGMILEKRDNYILMNLKSNNFDLEQGGIVVVDTLYNGANGERKSYEIQLAHSKNGWSLSKHGKTIKEIHIQVNNIMFIGPVGIKNLVMK